MNHLASEPASPANNHPGTEPASLPANILWCCHVRGPDEVHAAPDYKTALAWSDIINAINWHAREGRGAPPPASWDECLVKAAPAVWPWSAESHAEDIPKSIAGFTLPAHG